MTQKGSSARLTHSQNDPDRKGGDSRRRGGGCSSSQLGQLGLRGRLTSVSDSSIGNEDSAGGVCDREGDGLLLDDVRLLSAEVLQLCDSLVTGQSMGEKV